MLTIQMARVALVTGANQGLGFALVKALAKSLGPTDTVYLGARSAERGKAALETLKENVSKVELVQLDVTEPASISALASLLKRRHGGVDIVASNAAARMSKDKPQAEQVRALVATNNHGSRALYGALRPLLNRHARYVMVASSFGQLHRLVERLHPLFDTDALSLDEVEATMDGYVEAMEAGRAASEGWPEWINIPSKVGQVATARIAARDMIASRPNDGILINAVCPGLVDTAASRPWFDDMSQAQTPDEAAAPIIQVLLAPPDEAHPNGQLIRFGKTLPWRKTSDEA